MGFFFALLAAALGCASENTFRVFYGSSKGIGYAYDAISFESHVGKTRSGAESDPTIVELVIPGRATSASIVWNQLLSTVNVSALRVGTVLRVESAWWGSNWKLFIGFPCENNTAAQKGIDANIPFI